MQVTKRTPLDGAHREMNSRIIDFGGWELPVWYTSILEEHNAVRTDVGIFDVSHMGRIMVSGNGAGAYLDHLLTRPAQRLDIGGAHLCLLCLNDGGILDDLWVYRLEAERFLVIWNASNVKMKYEWISDHIGSYPGVRINDISSDTAMIAVQGPMSPSLEILHRVAGLQRFSHTQTDIGGVNVTIARTGYTGEDGFEFIVSSDNAQHLWQLLLGEGAKPCGLGARDILRLEAGMMLYGQDMDATVNPYEAGLGWLVSINETDFIGKKALLRIKEEGVRRKLIGFKMEGKEIPRHGYGIYSANKHVGDVTSGGYSPTLVRGIGLGYVPIELSKIGTNIQIIVHNKAAQAQVTNKRFLRRREQ